MRILYGIQGTGNGHITRARVMAECFTKLGIDVDYLFSGRDENAYFDMGVFGQYQVRRGLSFITQSGKLDYRQTAKQLKLGTFVRDVRQLDIKQYDLVFNDFEPVSAWAAKLAKVPVVAMSHQAAFLSPEVPLFGAGFMERALIRWFAPANVHLGVHWQPFAKNILPPFISFHGCVKASIANKILVYLPFEDLTSIVELLGDFPDREFYCYHPDARDQSLNHIHLRAPSRSGFLDDLASASGVVANAGFELSSEALKFGKKLLLKPLQGQFEQLSNAMTLQSLGLAEVMNYLNSEALGEWLEHPEGQIIDFPSDATPLAKWLANGQWQDFDSLHDSLWQPILYNRNKVA
ncbi:glycosyltransferase [Pseudoalteromonas luteoviolacea CPMOR-1]|uniref:Glycosyltransferase n=1 Tax=Pseudoalteromonas luteoviolacea CPMOR-1 TaxID=1365248 RepID=A0A167KPN8_9GAMM|nr:MJ1255/VC2487 family glycosyltransferase [Pseudoalteromonas luteoviolacea]KZN63092.1 glycosyltransferase [Pseudoalteromonas luteoviolacea CPMOR-1]